MKGSECRLVYQHRDTAVISHEDSRTELLADFRCPEDRVELDLAHAIRTLIDDLDGVVQ